MAKAYRSIQRGLAKYQKPKREPTVSESRDLFFSKMKDQVSSFFEGDQFTAGSDNLGQPPEFSSQSKELTQALLDSPLPKTYTLSTGFPLLVITSPTQFIDQRTKVLMDQGVIAKAIQKASSRLLITKNSNNSNFNKNMEIFKGLPTYIETSQLFEKMNVMFDNEAPAPAIELDGIGHQE